MKTIDVIAEVLLIVGAINWLLVGLFQWDLVAALFGGEAAGVSRIIYTLVGIAGVYLAVRLIQDQGELHHARPARRAEPETA